MPLSTSRARFKKRLVIELSVLLILAGHSMTWGAPPPAASSKSSVEHEWRLLPIRPKAQVDMGQVGGEGMQHMQGTTRSPSHPDIIYMAHDVMHFWKSIDGGKTWRKPKSAGCRVQASQSIAIDPVNPQIVLAVVDAAWNYYAKDIEGLYRSTDGGENWELVLPAPTLSQRFYQHNIAYDPTSVNQRSAMRWYVALPGDALYRSDDGGETWKKLAALKEQNPLYAIEANPTDGRSVYLASKQGLFITRDQGKTIQPLGNLPKGDVSSLAVEAKSPRRLWAVLKDKGLYRSDDSGKTFQLIRKHDAIYVFINPAHPKMLFLVGAKNTSLGSNNGGKTWYDMAINAKAEIVGKWTMDLGGNFTGIVPDPRDPKQAIAFNRSRFWRTVDGGKTWTNSSSLFTGFAWGWGNNGIAFDPNNPNRFGLMCFDSGMLFTDNDGTWFEKRGVPWRWYQKKRVTWTGMYAGAFQPTQGSNVLLATVGYYHRNKIIRSNDAGKTWVIVDDVDSKHMFLGFHPKDPNLAFSANKQSIDAGKTWKAIPFLLKHKAEIMGLCLGRPDTLYATNRAANTIYRSDDRGKSWRQYAKVNWRFNGLSSKQTFTVDPKDPNVIYTLGKDRDVARFDGKTWTSLGVLKLTTQDHHNYPVNIAVDPRQPAVMYAATRNLGVPFLFRSLDRGKTWEDITRNLPFGGACGLAVNPHTGELLRGGAGGTWILPPPYVGKTPLYDKAVQIRPHVPAK